MSIDNRIYDAIESNSNIKDKSWFNQNLQFAKTIYDTYEVDYNFDNIIDIIKTIKIVETSDNKNIKYDKETNTLINGNNTENMEYYLCKSFLEITSQRYDEKLNKYSSGIIYDDNNQELGVSINNMLIDELITINTGLSVNQEKEITSINPLDTIIKDILSLTGFNSLVSYFAFGQGDLLFENISNVIGYDNTKQFYNAVDNYENNPKLNKIIYDLCINALLNSKEETNTMSKM